MGEENFSIMNFSYNEIHMENLFKNFAIEKQQSRKFNSRPDKNNFHLRSRVWVDGKSFGQKRSTFREGKTRNEEVLGKQQ